MTGLDVEAVLGTHTFAPNYGDSKCRCGEPIPTRADHRAHVAAVLRVEIESALADAWDDGYFAGWGDPSDDQPNPYRPTLAADEGDRQ